MVATEGLGLANCQAIVSPKSGGAHAARVPRSISSTILFLLLGGGGAAGLVKLAGDRGGLQPGEMAQGYPDINGEGVSPAAQMAASDEDASSINDAGPNKPAADDLCTCACTSTPSASPVRRQLRLVGHQRQGHLRDHDMAARDASPRPNRRRRPQAGATKNRLRTSA